MNLQERHNEWVRGLFMAPRSVRKPLLESMVNKTLTEQEAKALWLAAMNETLDYDHHYEVDDVDAHMEKHSDAFTDALVRQRKGAANERGTRR